MIDIKIIVLLSLVSFVACGSGPNSPIDDDPIEQLSNDDKDRLSDSSNPLNEGVQNNDIDLGVNDSVKGNINNAVMWFCCNSSEQRPVNANFQEHEVRTHRNWTFTSPSLNCKDEGYRQGTFFWAGDVAVYIGDKILIDNKKVQGITESRTSFVIKWNEGVLYVDDIPQVEFEGIRGTGTLEFLSLNIHEAKSPQ